MTGSHPYNIATVLIQSFLVKNIFRYLILSILPSPDQIVSVLVCIHHVKPLLLFLGGESNEGF